VLMETLSLSCVLCVLLSLQPLLLISSRKPRALVFRRVWFFCTLAPPFLHPTRLCCTPCTNGDASRIGINSSNQTIVLTR
jgi:hypothetical protein